MQVESEFITYSRPLFDRGIDDFVRAMEYKPFDSPFTRTIPGKHVTLAKIMYRIGYWFTEKAEDWDDRTFFVMPKREPTEWNPTGAFTIKVKGKDQG